MTTQMKIITAAFSVFLGIAFAYPLYYSDVTVPLNLPPKGPTADMVLSLEYANITVTPLAANATLPKEIPKGENASMLTYDVVLNVTNNCSRAASISDLYFAFGNGISTTAWQSRITQSWEYQTEGAWVDGIWYNVTLASAWVDGPSFPHLNQGSVVIPSAQPVIGIAGNAVYHQGVQLYDIAVGGRITATWMNMNGTWTDVTGRIDVTHVEIPFENQPTCLGQALSETRFFCNLSNPVPWSAGSSGRDFTAIGSRGFDNVWQPNESRLIELTGSRIYQTDLFYNLTSKDLYLLMQANSLLVNGVFNGTRMDTQATADCVQQVRLQSLGASCFYSALNPGQTFQRDKWGVEVFVVNGS